MKWTTRCYLNVISRKFLLWTRKIWNGFGTVATGKSTAEIGRCISH